MHLVASDLYTLFRPSECALRVFLREHKELEGEPNPYEAVLHRLAERHEKTHLRALPPATDLSAGTPADREAHTRQAVEGKTQIIYQARLRATGTIAGRDVEIVGEPDFLILEGSRYVVRDAKISKRINERDHLEIILQLQLYGWLYERVFGNPPLRLEVLRGTGDIVDVPYDGGAAALQVLDTILRLKIADAEPISPVGWTKCGSCIYHARCWPRAEAARDVALVFGVDQGLAMALYGLGIKTIDQLLGGYTEKSLGEVQRPWGKSMRRVGAGASKVLRMAKALTSGREELLKKPEVPARDNYVMFDLEGLPPQLDELEKVYLWGLQVYGDRPKQYLGVAAGIGSEGDRVAWGAFRAAARQILSDYGDIPFVHWHHYERTKLDLYVDRFGDPDGTASRVRQNLLDLLPITQSSIVLPLSSYSLKVVEQYVGFRRTQDEHGGQWAMAKYIEAVETEDPDTRAKLMEEIFKYNEEDLAATWEVLKWLGQK